MLPFASQELGLLNAVHHVVLLSDSAVSEGGRSPQSAALALGGARTQPVSQHQNQTHSIHLTCTIALRLIVW